MQPHFGVLNDGVFLKRWFGCCFLILFGCTGAVQPDDTTDQRTGVSKGGNQGKGANEAGAGASANVESQLSTAVVRRLNKFEYNNVVRDLFDDASNPASEFTAEESTFGFSNNAAALTVPPLLAEQYLYAAEGLARRGLPKLGSKVPCLAKTKDEACALSFVNGFGAKLWRGPVANHDQTRLLAIFNDERSREGSTFETAMEAMLTTMLISAPFLYRIEVGEEGSDGKRRLTSYETASRLSFFLWGTTPDDELLSVAARDQLRTRDQVAAQATRMVKNNRALEMVRNFHGQWLRYGALSPQVTKDLKTFATFDAGIALRMKQESDLFVQNLFSNPVSTYADLFLSSKSFADSQLASFYGLNGAPAEGEFAPVDVSPSRPGILSRGAWLTLTAHNNQTSPTLRGKFILERLLCGAVPPPPPTVNNTPLPVSATRTTRERMEAHVSDPSCSGCHKLTDPLGFALEGFDAVGRMRSQDAGKPINVTATVEEGPLTGSFEGAPSLMRALAQSQEVRTCVAKHWLRYTMGRGETADDSNAIEKLAAVLGEQGSGVWPRLLVELTQTDAFLTLATQEGQ